MEFFYGVGGVEGAGGVLGLGEVGELGGYEGGGGLGVGEARRRPVAKAEIIAEGARRAGSIRALLQLRREGRRRGQTPLGDAVMKSLMDAVTHCLGHVDLVSKDRRRLDSKTGGRGPAQSPQPAFDCCRPARP